MRNKEEIKYLLERYISGKATEEEYDRLFRALDQNHDTAEWESLISQMAEQHPADPLYEKERWEPMIDAILHPDYRQAPKHSNRRTLPRIAAVLILLLGIGAWLGTRYWEQSTSPALTETKDIKNDILPGGNKAILTLANGETVLLDSMHNGTVALQGKTKIVKQANGRLAYSNSSKKPVKEIFNTLSTPPGGQYEIILPDDSKVWLNAASSIRFPTAFTGSERHVFIRGEAYFEVAEDAEHPFIVSTHNSMITVLGTSFNIKAYSNESAAYTTLLEGSVKVTVPHSKKSIIIKPGMQASVYNTSRDIQVKKVNAANIASWIHGQLSLNDCSVREFMNQLSRWYNVDIEYTGAVPGKRFGGLINRNVRLSDVLSVLDAAGIHTKLEGKKIIVLSQ